MVNTCFWAITSSYELEEVYGYRPNVKPVVTAATMPAASSKQPNSTQPNVPLTSTPKSKCKKMIRDESENVENSSKISTSSQKKSNKKPKTNNQEMVEIITKIHKSRRRPKQRKWSSLNKCKGENVNVCRVFKCFKKEQQKIVWDVCIFMTICYFIIPEGHKF